MIRALVLHELRTSLRSVRFRIVAVVYLVVCCAPAVGIFLQRDNVNRWLGPGTYAAATSAIQPIMTAILAFVLAADALVRERDEGSLIVVTLAPATNAGYALGRWLAVLICLTPLTVLPPVSAAVLAAWGGAAPGAPSAFVGPWLVHTLPILVVATTGAIGLGTTTGGSLRAQALAMAALLVALSLLNLLLARFQQYVSPPFDWLGLSTLTEILALLHRLRGDYPRMGAFSDAPWDASIVADAHAPAAALAIFVAAPLLAGTILYLRRTAANLRPLRVGPNHPLRDTVALLNQLRVTYTPDPALTRRDWAALTTLAVVSLTSLAYTLDRAATFRALATECYWAETRDDLPRTPMTAKVESVAIEATLTRAGALHSTVAMDLVNSGEEPLNALAFQLNEGMQIRSVHIQSVVGDEQPVSVRRHWDRVVVELTPAVAPAARRSLRFELTGRPRDLLFDLPPGRTFAASYEALMSAKFTHQVTDLSRSQSLPHASRRRIAIESTDILPVPRYAAWRDDKDGSVPAETFLPTVDVRLDMTADAPFLVDSCGAVAGDVGSDGTAYLRSRCRSNLTEYAVRGGDHELLAIGGLRVAVLPAHREVARLHFDALSQAAIQARRAWPGIDPLANTVLMEWSPRFVGTGYRLSFESWFSSLLADGSTSRLMLIDEASWGRREPLDADELVAAALGQSLMSERAIVSDQQNMFRQLFRVLALLRVGRLDSNAVLTGPGARGRFELAIDERLRWSTHLRSDPIQRLIALVVDLQNRVGPERLETAVGKFLEHDERPGTLAELFELLEQVTGDDLDPVLNELFLGRALPQLRLSQVGYEADGDGWLVTGVVRNENDGHARCPIVVRTDIAATTTSVEVAAAEDAPFAVRVAHRPRSVSLDPERRCFRFQRSPRTVDGHDRVELGAPR